MRHSEQAEEEAPQPRPVNRRGKPNHGASQVGCLWERERQRMVTMDEAASGPVFNKELVMKKISESRAIETDVSSIT